MLSTVGRGIVQHRSHFGINGPALTSQPWSPRGELGGMGILMVKDSSPDAARGTAGHPGHQRHWFSD